MNDQRVVRIGVLGAARIVPEALLKPASKISGVSVDALASRSPEKAQQFAEKHGILRVHSTYDQLLSDPEIDAVYIPLPNSLHASWSIKALQAGKHVLCEKPIASNAQQAAEVAEVARETGLVLCEAVHARYHPLAARMKEIVDSGDLGKIQHVEVHLCVPLLTSDPIRYRFDLSGGAMMDVGCYAVNMLRFLTDEEPAVTRARAKLSSDQVDRWMEADFKFPSGATGHIVCSIRSLVLLRLKAIAKGDQGEMHVRNPFLPHKMPHRIQVRDRSGVRREKVAGDPTYDYQLSAFAKAVRNGESVPTDARDFVPNMSVIDAIYRAAGLKPRGT